ncbi:MAG: HlyD family secretion protein [Saprospiraceae bacterium]
MRYFNLFYILVFLIGITLWRLNTTLNTEVVSFYGFAENKETEINFNYPVAVGKIYVQEGQLVKAGEKLLDMYRIKSKERLSEEPFRIAELRAREKVWRNEREGEILDAKNKEQQELANIDAKIADFEKERKFRSELYEDIATNDKNYTPLLDQINNLKEERQLTEQRYQQAVKNLESELKLGKNPYALERQRLQAEQNFAEANTRVEIPLVAPHDGVVGNLYCKEGEHIESFATLVSFYEPNPTLVEGYVQEDLILHVTVNDSFKIRSTKNPDLIIFGQVTGLGSRIVEIPERLRKIPTLKTYGREILVSIPSDNNFLQKEQVILEFVNPPEHLHATNQKKPLSDIKME